MSNIQWHVLNEAGEVVFASRDEALQWWDSGGRHVARANVDGFRITAIFLPINHGTPERPLFFEVKVSCPEGDQHITRHATKAECLAAFDQAVRNAESGTR